MQGKKAIDGMQDPNQQLFFTVCPRCNYPGHHPNAEAWGAQGGKAKVPKGFAVAGQPSAEARKLGWIKRKARAEAKAQATRAAQREAKSKAEADG